MALHLTPTEVKALDDEFAELIRREPECSIETIFDEVARRRVGIAISRLAQRLQRTGM